MKSLSDIMTELSKSALDEQASARNKISKHYDEKKSKLKEAHYKKYKNKETAKAWCEQNGRQFHWCDETRVVFDAGGGQVWASWDRVLDYLPVYD